MKKVLKSIAKFIAYGVITLLLIIGVMVAVDYVQNKSEKKEVVMQGTVEVVLDENEEYFRERMDKGKFLDIYKHPAGLTRYMINFDFRNKEHEKNTHIKLKVGDSSLTFDYPIDISIFPEIKKMNDISLSLGLGAESIIMHEEAKAHMYEILEQIVDAGWKRYISTSSPRICGKEAFLTELLDSNISGVGLDPNYFMNFKEWFSISTYHWHFFYKNEAFMDVTLHRQSSDKDLEKPGGYFLSIDIKSVEHVARSNFKPELRDNWRELFLKELPRWRAFRPEEEAEAIAKGYHICTDHEDAPLDIGILPPPTKDETQNTPSKPKSLVIRSGTLCPKSGLWQAFLPPSHPQAKLIEKSNAHTIHCAKDTHILKFGLSPEDEAQVRWLFISEDQESYNPNK